MKKRIFAVISAIAFCFAMAGCDSKENSQKDSSTTAVTTEKEKEEEVMVEKIEYEIDPSKPVIALTFDDGPNTTTTMQVLEVLDKYGVKASFFVVGDNVNEETAKVMKLAYDKGHEIDNHSRTHTGMSKLSVEEIQAEVKFVDEVVEKYTGEKTKYFRPPYIDAPNKVLDAIDIPFICGIGCNDWDDKVEVDKRVESIVNQTKDGVIILLHDSQGNTKTVSALDQIIPKLLEEGYQFATVDELFKAKGVTPHPMETKVWTLVE